MEDEEEVQLHMKADMIRDKRKLMMNEARMKKSIKNKAQIPRSKKARTTSQMAAHFNKIGLDSSAPVDRARATFRNAPADNKSNADSAMDLDTPSARARSVSRAPKTNRLTDGVTNTNATGVTDPMNKEKAQRMAKVSQRKMNRMARQGEADRHETAALPKWLLAGKRGMGTSRSR
jgi:nucleolar GTP-binding protein